jgi:pimeloyl-ACP methyl ester carboxylesterase
MSRFVIVAAAVAIAALGAILAFSRAGESAPALGTDEHFFNGDVRLSYQLTRPAGPGPFPAVVFGHGSGRQDKTSCRFMAARFVGWGYATLCFDKRGVGQSTGQYSMVGPSNSERMFADLGGDMAAGVRFLRSLPDIRDDKVGLVGVSQAGWIIPVAAQMAQPAFMVIIVGPTVTVGEEIFYSRFAEESTTPLSDIYPKLREFTGQHGFDPRPVLEGLDTPGLWLLGGEDRSIPTPRTTAILDQLKASGRRYSYVVYPNFGHNLGGAPLWPDVERWLSETVGVPSR